MKLLFLAALAIGDSFKPEKKCVLRPLSALQLCSKFMFLDVFNQFSKMYRI